MVKLETDNPVAKMRTSKEKGLLSSEPIADIADWLACLDVGARGRKAYVDGPTAVVDSQNLSTAIRVRAAYLLSS